MALLQLKCSGSDVDGWGPSVKKSDDQFIPYSMFNQFDRIGKPADFVSSTSGYSGEPRRDRYTAYGSSTAAFSYTQNEEETSFSLVDTKPKPKARFGIARIGGTRGRGRGRGGYGGGRGGHGQWQQGGVRWAQQDTRSNVGPPVASGQGNQGQQQQNQRKKSKGRWENRRRFGPRDWDRVPRVVLPSVTVGPEWNEVAQLTLAQLEASSLPFLEKTSSGKRMRGRNDDSSEDEASRILRESQSVQTLYECGIVNQYDTAVDRITTRSAVKLRSTPTRFSGIHPDDDTIMSKLAADGAGEVYATDTVVSLLMSACRSVAPWDIIARVTPKGIFLDRRPSSLIACSTVNETGQDLVEEEPPADSINHSTQLMHEATNIQRAFVAQVVRDEACVKFPDVRSGPDTGIVPSAYRYRRFQLGDNRRVVVRSEIQAAMEKKSGTEPGQPILLSVRSVLEFDAKSGGGSADWRQKLDAQRGYVIATEFRNNACKLTRWIAQALLSGVNEIRMGFVSRVSPSDAKQHSILGVQRFKPLEFAQQVGVKPTSLWGSLNLIVETLEPLPHGTYVIMRDPNDPIIRFIEVPEGITLN